MNSHIGAKWRSLNINTRTQRGFIIFPFRLAYSLHLSLSRFILVALHFIVWRRRMKERNDDDGVQGYPLRFRWYHHTTLLTSGYPWVPRLYRKRHFFSPFILFLSQCAFTGELKIKMHSRVRTERQGRWKGIFETTRMAFDWVIIQCLIKEYIRIWLVITFLAAAASACCCSCCWRFWLLLLDGAKRSANRFGVSFFLLLLTGETSPKSMVKANGSNLMEQHSLPSSSSSSLTRCCFSTSPPPIAVAAAATKPDAVELSESLLKSSNDDEAVVDAVAAVEVAATGRFSTAMHVDPVSGIQWPGFHAIEIKKKKKKKSTVRNSYCSRSVWCGIEQKGNHPSRPNPTTSEIR